MSQIPAITTRPDRSLPPTDPETLRQIALVIAKAAGASKVILFGSVARGVFRRWSDLDWLLVMPDEAFGTSFLEQLQPAMRAAAAVEEQGLYLCPMDFLPQRYSDFIAGQNVIAHAAATEGIVFYGANTMNTNLCNPIKRQYIHSERLSG
jgi:poly(A) polymerase Pap1